MFTKEAKFVISSLRKNDNQAVQRIKDSAISDFVDDAKTA
jgi:hypothetical protein